MVPNRQYQTVSGICDTPGKNQSLINVGRSTIKLHSLDRNGVSESSPGFALASSLHSPSNGNRFASSILRIKNYNYNYRHSHIFILSNYRMHFFFHRHLLHQSSFWFWPKTALHFFSLSGLGFCAEAGGGGGGCCCCCCCCCCCGGIEAADPGDGL